MTAASLVNYSRSFSYRVMLSKGTDHNCNAKKSIHDEMWEWQKNKEQKNDNAQKVRF